MMPKPSHSSPGSHQPRDRSDVARTGGNRRTGDYPRGHDALLPADGAPVRPAPRLEDAPGTEHLALAHLVAELAHMRTEHGRLKASAQRQRRHLETQMAAVEATFERLLGEWTRTGKEREAWRAALHGLAPIPDGIEAPVARLVFRGRTSQGVAVDVYERADGQVEVDLDGQESERLVDRLHLTVDADGWSQIADVRAQETFEPAGDAERALHSWMKDGGTPPWEHARRLLAEGLVDATFAVTPRGRRAMASADR